MLPGIILPLVWSINIPVVNTSWKKIFTELVGSPAKRIDAENLAKSFYYRAYFNTGIIGNIFEILGMPRESLEIMTGVENIGEDKPKMKMTMKSIRYLPRLSLFFLRYLFFEKKFEHFITRQVEKNRRFKEKKVENLNETETIQQIDELITTNIEASYYTILARIISEIYSMMIKKLLEKKKLNIEIVTQITSRRIHDIDPRVDLKKINMLYKKLSEEEQKLLSQDYKNTKNNKNTASAYIR